MCVKIIRENQNNYKKKNRVITLTSLPTLPVSTSTPLWI